MAFRSYTFLAPLFRGGRERGLSFNEDDYTETSRYIRHQSFSIAYPFTPSKQIGGSNMQDRELIISPGNILSKSCTWRKGNESASEELYESLKSCLEQQKRKIEANAFANGNYAEIITPPSGNPNEEIGEIRSELKITVKLFLYSLNSDDILSAIRQGLKNSEAEYLDTLVVSFAGKSEATPLSMEVIQKVWSVLEGAVKSNVVKMIGLCDLDPQLFIRVYEWASVKPSIVQINLASCCVVPPELAVFAKEHDIQLLTHSDPINILPEEKQESLVKSLHSLIDQEEKPVKWNTKWALRYQIHVKCRGVLATKGYVVAISSSDI